jgi:hypothetical protein
MVEVQASCSASSPRFLIPRPQHGARPNWATTKGSPLHCELSRNTPLRMAGFFAWPNYGILGDGDTERPGRVTTSRPTRFKIGGNSYEKERHL